MDSPLQGSVPPQFLRPGAASARPVSEMTDTVSSAPYHTIPKMSHFFIHNCCRITLQVSRQQGRNTFVKKKWKVKLISRGAYWLSGTGTVEKYHRTIKRMAGRSGRKSPPETDLIDSDPIFYDSICMYSTA